MQFKALFQSLAVAGSIAILSACSAPGTTKSSGSYQGSMNGHGASGAQTSGVSGDARFSDSVGPNALLAKRTYYFNYDSAEIQDQFKPAILANADYLIAHPHAKIVLEGHTDPRGSREYNVGLGERRANAVAQLMKSKGVNPTQIRVVSYGAERLAVSGRSEHDFQLDRRVVLVFTQ